MSESKQTRRDVIDAELQKTKAELAIAKHREACAAMKALRRSCASWARRSVWPITIRMCRNLSCPEASEFPEENH